MEEKSNTQSENTGSRDLVLDLNFVPQWARKPPGESHYAQMEYSDADGRNERRGRNRTPRDDRRHDERPRPRRASSDQQERRASFDQRERSYPPREREEPIEELPITVSFLPEQKRLASLVRQIHHSRRAYPLMDLANLLIRDPEGYLVKIEADKEFQLFQCNQCKTVSRSEDELRLHILGEHLTDFYTEEEALTDPPSGSFPGVARCRITGILLGPPNHHSYIEKLNELHQSRFAHLPLEEYKRNVEVVKDEELIEQWREESRKQVVYRMKSDPEAEPIDRRRAELAFAETIDGLVENVHRAVMPARAAQKLKDRSLMHAVHLAWSKENRFSLSMSFSMRAAFRHMHLYMFKAGKVNFVTHVKPHPIRPEDTVSNIAEVLVFLEQNPGSTRQHLLEVLHPTLDPKSKEAMEALQPLSWLIERGHIIEFFNGTLSIPLGRRAKV
jgi:hypothetical protein